MHFILLDCFSSHVRQKTGLPGGLGGWNIWTKPLIRGRRTGGGVQPAPESLADRSLDGMRSNYLRLNGTSRLVDYLWRRRRRRTPGRLSLLPPPSHYQHLRPLFLSCILSADRLKKKQQISQLLLTFLRLIISGGASLKSLVHLFFPHHTGWKMHVWEDQAFTVCVGRHNVS